MARIFTTPDAEAAAKAWLHDITLAAGIRTNNQRGGSFNFPSWFATAAQKVCDELLNRDFENIDAEINSLSGVRFNADLTGSKRNYKSYKPEGVAKTIVYMAELLDIYWDDTVRTPYEVDEFKKTKLGAAVFKYGRCISAVSNKSTRKAASKSSTPKAAGQAPANGYKQSGPQSANVRDLQGTPGQKVYADTNVIYRIVGENPQSKNVPTVFVKPLSASGAEGTTNKIFFSSGNGYTDCICFFDDPNDANTFMQKLINAGRVPANVSNVKVVQRPADTNGYFIVGTEFGPCAISAQKLNEALVESTVGANKASGGWEKATEGYSKEELEELHTWMRRG